MHVHVNPFQITRINTSMLMPGTTMEPFYKLGDWHDNILMPMLGDPMPFTQADDAVRLRFQPGPFTGYSLMHCHFLSHEDLGCMKVVQFKCPGFGDVQPAAGRCPGFSFPVKGAE
jgi:FtsP/CotA-like multicopper oxidase with cupredoxin domain